jgi:hypothetical protein
MATSPRSLRIGVLINDQLVEERLFDGAAPITLGQSLRCALSVPVEGVPREHVLFTVQDGRFVLHETPRMTVTRADGRGRLTIGEATILFQEVATPPPAPRPQLPAAIRGTLADRIDRRVALFVGGSLIVHIGIAAWAWTGDVPTEPLGLPRVATTYHEDIIDVTVPETPALPPQQPGAAVPATPHQTPRPIVRSTNIETPPKPTSDDDAQRLASILTGDSAGEQGRGGMNAHQPGTDLGKQIDDARNHTITIGDGTHTSRNDDRARIGTTPETPLVNDPTLTRTDHHEDTLKPRVTIGPVKPDDSTTLTPATVLDRINTLYMVGLQRCYKDGLRFDSTLSGRVAISFTVDERGQVIDPEASGVSSGVDTCVRTQMTHWRFPIPKDKDGDATDASFAVTLALQPS